MYKKGFKRLIDIVLSACGLIVLSPVFLILCLAVVIDDPGPVFFTQKRIAKNKDGKIAFFKLYKFRSMKMSTPHDMPTHLLENPEQYITRMGRFLRKSSLDELPQIWNILKGDMSIVGPRPALWNQDDLYAEREKYGANDVTPGLTGWAQVNGRDELEIDVKAKLDGDYVKNLTLKMDMTCFWMTIANVLKHTGVVEGGTGTMAKHVEKRNSEIEDNIRAEYNGKKVLHVSWSAKSVNDMGIEYIRALQKAGFKNSVMANHDEEIQCPIFKQYPCEWRHGIFGLGKARAEVAAKVEKHKYDYIICYGRFGRMAVQEKNVIYFVAGKFVGKDGDIIVGEKTPEELVQALL